MGTHLYGLAERSYLCCHSTVAPALVQAGLQELQGHSKKVHTVGWSSDGKRLASGSVDKTVNIWKVGASGAPATLEHELQGHTEAVDRKLTLLRAHVGTHTQRCCAPLHTLLFLRKGQHALLHTFAELTWDPSNPDQLASASSDKSVRIWDGRMGKCAAMIPTKGENINIAWSPDGTTIAVGDKADQVSFIDKRTHAIIGKPWAFKTEMNELSWNNTGNLFFLTTGNGTVEVHTWGAAGSAAGPGKPIASLPAHTQSCYCIKFDSRDKHFAVGSADALVSIWDLSTFTCVRTIDRLE